MARNFDLTTSLLGLRGMTELYAWATYPQTGFMVSTTKNALAVVAIADLIFCAMRAAGDPISPYLSAAVLGFRCTIIYNCSMINAVPDKHEEKRWKHHLNRTSIEQQLIIMGTLSKGVHTLLGYPTIGLYCGNAISLVQLVAFTVVMLSNRINNLR